MRVISLNGVSMGIKKVSKSDLFGIFYVRKLDGRKWESYYKTLEALRPLFKNEQFQEVVNGYYLNICGDFDAVRISYFAYKGNAKEAVSIFKRFLEENDIMEINDSRHPEEANVAKKYGGEEYEERFRNYLVLETKIGLDLIKEDLLHARTLLATYRWQVRKASLPFREHFEPTFRRSSLTYNSLSEKEKDQFFTDLAEWPNPPQVDWAHMMVNFVLGCDWNQVFSDPNYLTRGKPLSLPEINMLIRNLGFQIPQKWKP